LKLFQIYGKNLNQADEFNLGFQGGPSIEYLEQNVKHWRKTDKEKQYFSRRKRVIDFVDLYSRTSTLSIERCLELLEARRKQKGRSLDWMAKNKLKIISDFGL
jgi:hypothetical protein